MLIKKQNITEMIMLNAKVIILKENNVSLIIYFSRDK